MSECTGCVLRVKYVLKRESTETHHCRVTALGAGWTSTSVLCPSPSWKTYVESVQTNTGKGREESFSFIHRLVLVQLGYWLSDINLD